MTSAGAEAFQGMYREADGADEVRKAAREQLKAGAVDVHAAHQWAGGDGARGAGRVGRQR